MKIIHSMHFGGLQYCIVWMYQNVLNNVTYVASG